MSGHSPTRMHSATPTEDNAHLELVTRPLLVEARVARKHLIATEPDRPWTGEWARFGDGTMRRIAHVWEWGEGPESIQTSDGGSFHLSGTGRASMSGSLYSGLKPDLFTLSEDVKRAWFWIWRDGRPMAHNGVDVSVDSRVWDVDTLPHSL